MTTKLRAPVSTYLIKDAPPLHDYLKIRAFLNYARLKRKHMNVAFVGPKGISKTLSVRHFAKDHGIPLIVSECSEDARRSTLIGSFILKGNETPFLLGDVTTAIDVANEHGEAILLLEEMNTLTQQMQKLLNPATDFRRAINVPELEQVVALNPNSRLWVFGTMNEGYSGTYSVNEDLKSRFRMLRFEYPSVEDEKAIIKANVPKANETVMNNILTLAKETRSADSGYALSPRDTVAFMEDVQDFDVKNALQLLLGKFDADTAENIKKRIVAIFGTK